MFGFFKKDKKEDEKKTINHPVMGKLTFDDQWYGKFDCRLFNSVKEIMLAVYVDEENTEDMEAQEKAYSYYCENVDKVNSKMECELRYTYELDDDFPLESRFEPSKFIIYPNGACGISFRDHEEDEYSAAGYVVFSIRPRVIYAGSEHDY